MELVMQPTPQTCGQACIAMITGQPIEQVIKDMKTYGPTSIGQLIEALDFYGVRHAEKNLRISKQRPAPSDFSVLTVHMNAGYSHWAIYYHGSYYCPEFGLLSEYTAGKITSFLGITE